MAVEPLSTPVVPRVVSAWLLNRPFVVGSVTTNQAEVVGRPVVVRMPEGEQFPRSARLLTPAAYRHVFEAGQRVHSGLLMAAYRPNEGGFARLGLAVTKRAVKRAHERNRIKRLAREHFRVAREQLPAVDLIVMVKPGVDGLDNQALNGMVQRLLKKVAARCDASSSS